MTGSAAGAGVAARTVGAGLGGAAFGAAAGIGWIEMYLWSQTIRFGAYHHGVKKRWNWATVSFLFGTMS